MKRGTRSAGVLVLLSLLLAACGSGGGTASPNPSTGGTGGSPGVSTGPKVKVTLQTDFTMNGGYAPILAAAARGYFADVGLDVKIQQGSPGGGNTQSLSTGGIDFLWGSIDEIPEAVAEGMDIKAVSVYTHGNLNSIIVPDESRIKTLKDLEGATVGIPTGGGPPYEAFPDMLREKGVDASKVKLVESEFRVLGPSMLQGQFDAINVRSTGGPELEISSGRKIRIIHYKDIGWDFLGGTGLMVTNKTIKERPEVVRAMVRALIRGWADSLKDPDAVIDIGAQSEFKDAFLVKKAQVERLKIGLATVATADSKKNGIGYSTDAEWKTMIDLAVKYGGLKDPKPLSTYYTNEFLPKEPILP